MAISLPHMPSGVITLKAGGAEDLAILDGDGGGPKYVPKPMKTAPGEISGGRFTFGTRVRCVGLRARPVGRMTSRRIE